MRVAFLGVFAATPLWLIFALRASRPRCLERLPFLPGLIALPQTLAFLALLTNSAHHGMLREGKQWSQAFFDFAGPWMLGFGVISALWMLAAAVLLLTWAWRLWRRAEVHRASVVALALAGVVPLAGYAARVVVPATTVHAVFPASFVVAVLLLAAGPLRERLLRGVPLGHRDVFESLRDGVLVANAAGAIADANPAAERLLGRELSRLRGRELADVIAELAVPERSSSLRRELEDVAASPAPLRLDVGAARRPSPRGPRRLRGRRRRPSRSAATPCCAIAPRSVASQRRRGARRSSRPWRRSPAASRTRSATRSRSCARTWPRSIGSARPPSDISRRGRRRSPSELVDLRGLAQEALEGIARIERIAAGMRRLSTASEGFAARRARARVDEAVQLARIRFARPLDVELRLEPELPSVRGAPALLVQALLHLLVAAQRGASRPAPRSACAASARARRWSCASRPPARWTRRSAASSTNAATPATRRRPRPADRARHRARPRRRARGRGARAAPTARWRCACRWRRYGLRRRC